jgi:hypothetical protein
LVKQHQVSAAIGFELLKGRVLPDIVFFDGSLKLNQCFL